MVCLHAANPSSMPAPEALFANYVMESGLTQLVSELTGGKIIFKFVASE